MRVGSIDTRPIYFRFNKTESVLVIYLFREPLVGNETDSSESGDLVLCLRVTSQLLGGGLEAIAAYVYTHIMKILFSRAAIGSAPE